MKHYEKDDSTGFTNSECTENELISITSGWLGLSHGWYVQLSRRDLCIVEFGTTKRSALRYARRAWRKEWDKIPVNGRGYPKVIDCGE